MRSEKRKMRNQNIFRSSRFSFLISQFPLLISLFSLFISYPALAQTKAAAVPAPGKEQPMEITADQTLEWHRNDLQYIARGNVVARQGAAAIHCDTLTADYRQSKKSSNEIYRLTAVGHVAITSQNNTATGDKAVYTVDDGIAVMTGKNLTMTAPDQTVTARDNFEYETATGRLIANGDARAVKKTDKGNDVITSDKLSAWTAQDSAGKRTFTKMAADGHVVITTPTDILHGDNGTYMADTQIATVTGHVRINRGPNVLEGEKADINLATNVSRMIGTGGERGRVRGIFYPGSDKGNVLSLNKPAQPAMPEPTQKFP
jgi:lipopolysaccharide export system protein LptA